MKTQIVHRITCVSKSCDFLPLRCTSLPGILERESLVAQLVKNLPAVQEISIRFLGRKDPLEKGMATHSCILAWRIPWAEEPGRLQSMGSKTVGHDRPTGTFTS